MKNNVVGFRTTTELVSRDGAIPLSDTVKDTALVLSVIAGPSNMTAPPRRILSPMFLITLVLVDNQI